MTNQQRIYLLALSFPSLSSATDAPLKGWDPIRLAEWAARPHLSEGARHAARFVLSVWDPFTEWAAGRFDIHEAMKTWDDGNLQAFREWIDDPWWP